MLAFGVVGATAPESALADKLVDLTISWCRYTYRGPILLAPTVDAVLGHALARGFRHCFIQFAGHVVRERWDPGSSAPDLTSALADFAEREPYLVAAYTETSPEGRRALSTRCLLVDLARYREAGSPPFGDALIAACDRGGLPVRDIEPLLRGRTLDLGASCPTRAQALAPYVGRGGAQADLDPENLRQDERLDENQREFLGVIARQTANARRGVFLWNIESYDDVAATGGADGATGTLYSVAAGFKPNAILHRHGFDAGTRVVFLDYSPQALAVRRRLVEEWNGDHFPGFVRYLFAKHPSPGTYYHLWGDAPPEALDWRDAELAWRRELEWWGGAEAFRRHWNAYRRLPHAYIECDLLTDPAPALREVARDPRPHDIVWWSNAFFTMYGNWYYSQRARQASYERWMAGLAAANGEALVYGSDYANASVNGLRAGDYWSRYRETKPGFLEPAALHITEIRM